MVRCLGLLLCALFLYPAEAFALTFTINPNADAFVRSAAPTSNYGAAGANSVSGSAALNGSGQQMGLFDTFIRFSLASTVAQFDAAFGAGNWTLSNVSLLLTETAAPNNLLFNRGQGSFEVRWIASDTLVEGTGSPAAPTSDGIVYHDEPALLNPNFDITVGTFSNAQTNARQTFVLSLGGAAFRNDIESGGQVEFFLTAANPAIGFTFMSQNFGTASMRPGLEVTAVAIPEPATFSMVALGAALLAMSVLRRRRA